MMNFRTAVAVGVAFCGIAMQLACQAQDSPSSSSSVTASRPAASQHNAQAGRINFAALELPASGPGTAASESAAAATTSAASAGATAAVSSTTTAAPATVAVPVKEDAVIKELNEMKARIIQLEAELKARSGADDAADAEKDAGALRTAETGDAGASAGVGQAATPPPAAVAPAPPEISAEVTTKSAPFAGDWTWLNDNGHQIDSPMATKYFTPEFRADANYTLDMNHPKDDTLGGSTETFRSDEWQLEQLSIGGDIRINNVRGRILTMDGLFATTTPRNDGSPNRGQWDLAGAYKYISEGWGGYHWNVNHGLNVDAGIFVSYIGLFSYYNFDNWTYQPSFVSSNTPWFFNGLRIQWFPTAKLKIEPWIINGWQSYARYNGKPGLGGQILWRPKPWLDFVWNNYGLGEDDAGSPDARASTPTTVHRLRFMTSPRHSLTKRLSPSQAILAVNTVVVLLLGTMMPMVSRRERLRRYVYWRRELPQQRERQAEAGIYGLDGLSALLVPQGSLRCDHWRRSDE